MNPQSQKITLYGRPGCLMVKPVSRVLEEAQAAYEYVDIWQDQAGREMVQRINSGHESVPTILFPDGSSLTEPGEGHLRRKLHDLGYAISPEVPFASRVQAVVRHPLTWVTLFMIIFFSLRLLGFF